MQDLFGGCGHRRRQQGAFRPALMAISSHLQMQKVKKKKKDCRCKFKGCTPPVPAWRRQHTTFKPAPVTFCSFCSQRTLAGWLQKGETLSFPSHPLTTHLPHSPPCCLPTWLTYQQPSMAFCFHRKQKALSQSPFSPLNSQL